MTTQTITTGHPTGFTLTSSFSGLYISPTGSVGGTGVFVQGVATVNNSGQVNASVAIGHYGVYLNSGGEVDNFSTITGFTGVKSTPTFGVYPAGTVYNFGSIGGYEDGVQLLGGGVINNDFSDSITGGANGVYIGGGAGVVSNYGTIETVYKGSVVAELAGVQIGTGFVYNKGAIYGEFGVRASGSTAVDNAGVISGGDDGVVLQAGGTVSNGDKSNTTALISSYEIGVYATSAAVTNYGTIKGKAGFGVVLSESNLVNGAITDRGALVEGYTGIVTQDSNSNVSNFGVILGTGIRPGYAAVNLAGGTLVNGSGVDTSALIDAYSAVTVSAGGTVVNQGFILGTGLSKGTYGIDFIGGGALTNGSGGNHAATIEGYVPILVTGAAGSIDNLGTIRGEATSYFSAIDMAAGGEVTNGASFDPGALITGYDGIQFGAVAALSNFGTVNAADRAVSMSLGGDVVNGSGTDHSALISGYIAVIGGNAMAVTNFGTIDGTSSDYAAVTTLIGGSVTNGSGADLTAQIIGAAGVLVDQDNTSTGQGTIINYATISGLTSAGVILEDGGSVTNGRGTTRSSLIEGEQGVLATGAAATVTNFGTVLGDGDTALSAGVYAEDGGSLANGAVNNTTALVEGYIGALLDGAGLSTNFGTIWGAGENGSSGAYLGGGASLTNGSSTHALGLVEGYEGVSLGVTGANTLTNFGTINGVGGTAVQLGSTADDLAVGAGSSFIGAIYGDGGTLELVNGKGTLTGLLAVGNVTVSGSMAATTFTNFGTVQIDAPASFTLAGTGGTIAAGQALVVAGTLAGTGTLSLTGGTSTFNTGADLTIAKVTETGAATVANFNGPTITVADVWTQTSGQITVATGDKVNFTGVGDTFSGTLGGAGTVGFTGGTDALTGTKITAATTLAAGATVTLSGAIDLTSTATVTSANVVIAAAGATLSGAGTVSLTNAATNAITGATAGATLTNGDTIKGAGLLGNGQMVLINQASGVINATLTTALTINTGTSTVTNAGMIENAGTGGLIITGAVANTGTLNVTAGTLAVNGAVTGAGTVRISGGTADFASTFTENVTFTTTGGTLELAKSQTYTGQITGFAKTPVSSLDLLDIAFGTKTTATFSGTTTSGVLTVTDGTHTAKITLVGNYTTSTFTTASDGHGGTTVTDPPKPPAALPPMLPLVTAMAGFGSGAGASPSHVDDAWRNNPSTLASPGNATA